MGPARANRGGFTLVELLVVIAILAILMGLLIPALTNTIKRAQLVQCGNNLRQCYNMMRLLSGSETYRIGSFPQPGEALKNGTVTGAGAAWWGTLTASGYLMDARALNCPLTGGVPPAVDFAGPATGINPNVNIQSAQMLGRDKLGNHGPVPDVEINYVTVSGDIGRGTESNLTTNPAWGNSNLSQ